MGRRSGALVVRLREARRWLRSRGPVTLAAGLLLEVSTATAAGPRSRSLARATLLGLLLFVVLVAALADGLLSRLVEVAAFALRGVTSWSREHVLGDALPHPIPDELLRDRAGRPLRGGARTSRIKTIERDRARAARGRSLRGRTERGLAWLSVAARPYTARLVRVLLALERAVLGLRASVIGTAGSLSRHSLPRAAALVRDGRIRARRLAAALSLRSSRWSAPARAALARAGASLPGRAERGLRRVRAWTALAVRMLDRARRAVPAPAVPLPRMSLRTVRVVTAALMLSFVFATVIGTTGLVASRGSVALGASTTLAIISGEVLVSDAGSGEFRVATDGEVLGAGSTIKTGADAYAILTYFEGSTVSIDPSTVLVIESLFANPDGSTIIGMRQDVGQTWHAVTKLLTSGSKYEVRTPTATATVRGTLFLVGVVPGAAADVLETLIETTEGAVAAERAATDDTPAEEVVVPAGFQVRSRPAEALPPPVPAPEPERRVTVTVGATNSLVVDPQGRANGEVNGRIVVQTPGATVEKVDGRIVVTLPNTSDGKISTVIRPLDREDGEAVEGDDVEVVTVVRERGGGESRREERVRRQADAPVTTGVDVKKGAGDDAPPDLRPLDPSETNEAPTVKVAEGPQLVPPLLGRGGDDDEDDEDEQGDAGGAGGAPGETGEAGGGGDGGSDRAGQRGGVVNTIVTLTLPPLSAEELARREAKQREEAERERRERDRRDEERRQQEERRVAELRQAEEQARREAERTAREREREESRRREQAQRSEEPAPSPAGLFDQLFRRGGDDARRIDELRRAEEDAARRAERAAEERRRAEEQQRTEAIRLEEQRRRDAERNAQALREAEGRAKQEQARALEELRRIEEKAREQAERLAAEQRREAERRLEQFREAEERKRREEARAIEEQRRAEERARDEAERRLRELRREEESAREREREREQERRDDDDERRGRRGFTPTETLKPLPGVGSRSLDDEGAGGRPAEGGKRIDEGEG